MPPRSCYGRRSRTSHIRPSQTQTEFGLTPRYAAAGTPSLPSEGFVKACAMLGCSSAPLFERPDWCLIGAFCHPTACPQPEPPRAPALVGARPSKCDIHSRGVTINPRLRSLAVARQNKSLNDRLGSCIGDPSHSSPLRGMCNVMNTFSKHRVESLFRR